MKQNTVWISTTCFLVAIGIAGFALAKPKPTKGRIPEEAFQNGAIDQSLVPDFIVAYDQKGGIAGYVRKVDVFPDEVGGDDVPYIVVDESLTRSVGRMVPGRGFVPSGVPQSSVPMLDPGHELAEPDEATSPKPTSSNER